MAPGRYIRPYIAVDGEASAFYGNVSAFFAYANEPPHLWLESFHVTERDSDSLDYLTPAWNS
jgi:hypothetical protein